MSQQPLDYESHQGETRRFLTRRSLYALALSIALGGVWNGIAVCLMGGGVFEGLRPGFLFCGMIAGVSAGLFTLWSRRRNDGRESFFYGIANFYFGILVYWASFVVIQ